MIIKEFRIPMPMTLDEYRRGQVYSVAETAKRETGGGDGIEIITNEPFEEVALPSGVILGAGQYTLKKYHINKYDSFSTASTTCKCA
ncbi:phosphatidylinositol transfer protein alpha isoform-like [Folsomia candida]|uniref:phosphatidylinositol transfer protein alpha isoform-like n=1 Tax=Folsomia candida TaxID=158441 RepID=UPI001604CFDA|nr:phosphatidylinositol transfer protein alpha isoform-like [Folsomia candida]